MRRKDALAKIRHVFEMHAAEYALAVKANLDDRYDRTTAHSSAVTALDIAHRLDLIGFEERGKWEEELDRIRNPPRRTPERDPTTHDWVDGIRAQVETEKAIDKAKQ